MAKAKACGFKGYTAEEIEEEGKKDLLVLKEMLGEQQVINIFISSQQLYLKQIFLLNFTHLYRNNSHQFCFIVFLRR
jgi:hypothetical protein